MRYYRAKPLLMDPKRESQENHISTPSRRANFFGISMQKKLLRIRSFSMATKSSEEALSR